MYYSSLIKKVSLCNRDHYRKSQLIKMQDTKPNSNGYINKTSTSKSKAPLHAEGHRDCKNQMIPEFVVRMCLLVVRSYIH